MRRRALPRALLGALLASPAFSARGAAPIPLRISTAAPPADCLARALLTFRGALAQSAAGEFAVAAYPGSTLFREGTEVSALEHGLLDLCTATSFDFSASVPEWGFLDRAWLFRDPPHMRRVFDGALGDAYRQAVAARTGVQILATGWLGTRQLGLRVPRPISTPADLAGVKLRMPPGAGWALLAQVLGGEAVPMGMAELRLALRLGSIDAQDNPLSLRAAADLEALTPQIVPTAHVIQPVFLAGAGKTWTKLNEDQKQKLRDAAALAMQRNDMLRDAEESRLAAALPALDRTPFRRHADMVYDRAPLAAAWDRHLLRRVAAA